MICTIKIHRDDGSVLHFKGNIYGRQFCPDSVVDKPTVEKLQRLSGLHLAEIFRDDGEIAYRFFSDYMVNPGNVSLSRDEDLFALKINFTEEISPEQLSYAASVVQKSAEHYVSPAAKVVAKGTLTMTDNFSQNPKSVNSDGALKVETPPHYQKASVLGRPFLAALGIARGWDEGDLIDCCSDYYPGVLRNALLLSAAKYFWRLGEKNGLVEDIKKAQHYLELHVKHIYGFHLASAKECLELIEDPRKLPLFLVFDEPAPHYPGGNCRMSIPIGAAIESQMQSHEYLSPWHALEDAIVVNHAWIEMPDPDFLVLP